MFKSGLIYYLILLLIFTTVSASGQTLELKPVIANWQLVVKGKNNFPNRNFPIEIGTSAAFEAARILSAFEAEMHREIKIYNSAPIAQNYIARGSIEFKSKNALEQAIIKMKAIVRRNLPQTSATISFDIVEDSSR
ncbi:MAG: hypothetical protein HOH19_08060 [Kordiimonadaceae bacterium]|mgnify:CR=1 FL=1|jgi:hypothetical protein|nr:hypothetical protein [Kordiimonadaceae bacterium]MBT6032515.1 hypothetical protein [Kordiimonadaceae bacterium]